MLVVLQVAFVPALARITVAAGPCPVVSPVSSEPLAEIFTAVNVFDSTVPPDAVQLNGRASSLLALFPGIIGLAVGSEVIR